MIDPVAMPASPRKPAATSERRLGVALCAVSACGFGLMAIFAKEAYRDGLGVTSLLAARFVLAALAFWAIVAVRGTGPAPRRLVVACLALGAIGYSAQAGLFFSALRHIDASLASLLLYTYPALVFCAAVMLRREDFTARKAGALLLASGGAALVLLGAGSGGLEATGVLLALAAAVTYTTYILTADGIVARIDPFLLGALVATGAAATFLVVGTVGGSLQLGGGGWIWIVAIALLSTVLPIVTFMLGMARVGAATASIVSTVEPVVTVALAIALFGDALGPLQVFGGVLVLAAVVALQSRGSSSVRRDVAAAHAPAVAAARAPAGEPA
jgi:drug/metabolite transporter (DMT)-like permease